MWIMLVTLLLICGAFTLWDAPDRARRHAAERRSVLDALAAMGADCTASAIAQGVARRTGLRPSDRVVLGHLAGLEEDGMITVGRRGSAAQLRYALLVEVPAEPAAPTAEPLIVYHDGGCPLCAAEIAHYRRARGAQALRFVDVSAPDTETGRDLTQEMALARFHVRDGNGELMSGAAAFATLWRALPGWRWLGRIVGTRPVLPIAEAAYRALLPLRPRLARWLVAVGALRRPRDRLDLRK